MRPSKINRHRAALFLLGLWLLARMLVVVPIFREPFRVRLIDRNTYLELAVSLVERGTYTSQIGDNIDLVRTPAYPLFLAGILKLGGGNLAFIALVQLVLTLITAGLVYLTARHLAGSGAALAAAWLYALNPNSLFVALVALTESLFALLLTLSIYLLVRYREEPRWGRLLGSGLTLGLLVLVRPIAVGLVPVWMLFTLLVSRRNGWRGRLLPVAALALVAWAVFLPWQARNLVVHGEFTLSPVGGSTIRNWMIAEGLAEARGISRQQAVAEIAAADDPEAYSLALIGRYPGAMAVATLRGIYRTAMGFEYGTWTYLLNVRSRPGREFVNATLGRDLPAAWAEGLRMARRGHWIQLGLSLWPLAYNLAFYPLAGAGALLLWRRYRQVLGLAFLLVTVAYLLVIPFGAGQARFRVPAGPSLAILAGVGLALVPHLLGGVFARVFRRGS